MKKEIVFMCILSLITLNSCQNPQNLNTELVKFSDSLVKKNNIKGFVQFPKTGFGTKANFEDVAKDSSVSILYPSDHNTYPNKTIATGLTNSSGLFSINTDTTFSPNIGDIFILEASKRIGGVGSNIMSLRTFIKWTGTDWDSMTGTTIYINTYTNALSIIANYNKTTISSSDTIGKISVNGSTITPSDVGTNPNIIPAQTITDVSNLVTTVLTSNKDPFLVIKYSNSTYTIDTTGTQGAFILSTSCTGCDLTTMDLSNISLKGKNLTNANLSGKNLTNQDLSGTNLTGANLSGCNMSNMDLSNTTLTGANLSDAYLTNSKLTTRNLSGTNFSYAFLNGVDLSGSTLDTPNPTIFTNADLSSAKWIDNSVSTPHICANSSYGQCN